MKKSIYTLLTVIVFVALIIGILIGSKVVKKYRPSDERADLEEYYGNPSDNQAGVIVDNEVLGAHAMIVDNTIYLNHEIVKEYINSRFYWDSNENKLLYTLPTDIITAEIGQNEYSISNTKQPTDYIVVKAEGAVTYIAMDLIIQYSNMEYEWYDDGDVARLVITTYEGEITTAQVKNGTELREKGGIKSPILTELSKKDRVTILEAEDGDKWYKVSTEDGYIGYVLANKLSSTEKKQISRDFTEVVYENISRDYTINLAWHQVTSQEANNEMLTTIADTKGLTTISPTWFSVSSNDGDISSLANQQYVNYAKNSGLEVWGLVDNFNPEVDTHTVLSNTSSRENLENKLIGAALEYGLDGINVDFENVATDTGDHYIQFIRELSVKCRINGIILSVDNYVPEVYNNHYNLKEQGVYADYVIIMGYDEHYGGSPESGSVSSLGFVTRGIENALKEVPADKLINGVPFYTRLWEETPKSEEQLADEAGTEAAQYPYEVSSTVYGMNGAESHVAAIEQQYGIQREWNAEAGQYYLEYEEEGKTYKIWMEEEQSLEEKLKVMKENNLAGVASWKLGLERQTIWDIILKYVN